MLEVDVCPECRVPEPFNQGQVWLNNGDIVQRVNAETRMAFIECANLDPLFKNIGDLIGVSIEHIIVDIAARGTRYYIKRLVPKETRDKIQAKQADPTPFIEPIATYCHILGYGKYEFVDFRYERDENDFSIIRIYDPFSAPEAAGALAGAVSAVVGGAHAVTYKEVSPGLYEYKTTWSESTDVVAEKARLNAYKRRAGDIELERCATCGLPKAFSNYRWHLNKGLIVNERMGRRMAMLGPELLDAMFEALEEELGETIPELVVEAQRRFVRTGFYTFKEIDNEDEFRIQLALRGLGNLREINRNGNGMRVRIDNVAAHLLTIGMVQGLFEINEGRDSNVEWELTKKGDLEMEVKLK